MPRSLVLPLLSNWQDFEDLCLDLWRRLWNAPEAQKHGRQGQPQAGVDVYGRPDGGREWAGVQCKLTDRLTPDVIEEEVEKARTFEPALSRFVIVTTARSDIHCQKAARKITDAGFPVTVAAWDEICHHLEGHPDLLEKYFGIPRSELRRANSLPTGYRCMVALPPEGFVPREELNQIRDILCGTGASTVGITSALRGAGGFGKTTLAQALCFDARVRAAYPDGILWTTIGDQATEADRLSRVLDLIRWWTRADPPHFDTVSAAAAHLRETLAGLRVLVVVDDAWSAADIEPFRRAGAGLLVTTRLRETLPYGCACVDVDAMRLGEAVKLLMSDLPGAEGLRPRFEDLARTLGEWPLLLRLVNGTLLRWVHRGLGLEKALDEVAQAGLEDFDRRDSTAREKAVSRTMEVSLRHLSEEDRRRYEALAIFPEDENVPLRIVERWWACSAREARELSLLLHDLSLLRDLDLSAGTLRLHDVFRTYIIGRQGEAIAGLHHEFLARSRPASGRWADLPASETYLWRSLPYHLVHGGQRKNLRDLLLDVRFLAAKLRATDVNVLIAAFDYLPYELPTLQSAIRMSAHVLVRHPEQLAGQLLGRLPEGNEREGNRRRWEWLRQEIHATGKELFPGGAGLLPRRASLTPAGGPLLRTFEGHSGSVLAVAALGADRALSGSADKTVRLWNLATGTCLRTFDGHTGRIRAVAAVGEQWALSGAEDSTVRLWDLKTGACLHVFEGHSDPVLALGAVGKRWGLSGSFDYTLRLWDLETGALLHLLEGHEAPVFAAAVVGERLALSGSADGTLRLWALATGSCLRTFEGHSDPVLAVAIVEEGRALSGSSDGSLRLWDLSSGACLRSFEGHTGPINAVAVVSEKWALSGSDHGRLCLWDLETGACLHDFEGHAYRVHAMALVGKRRALSGLSDGTLRLWDFATGVYRYPVDAHAGTVHAVVAVEKGRALSGSADGTLRLWDSATGSCWSPFEGHAGAIYAVTTVADERALLGSENGLRVLDLETGTCLRHFEGSIGPVRAVTMVGEGRALSGSDDGMVRLWDLEASACLRVFKGHTNVVTGIVAVGERRALSGSLDRTVRLWDLDTGACLLLLEEQDGPVLAVASIGEKWALSGSDGAVRLWDLETGACLQKFEGHTNWVNSVSTVVEKRALSGSFDRTIRLWNLETGACLAVFTLDDPVRAVTVLNRVVVASDTGGNVHFLDLILPDSDPT